MNLYGKGEKAEIERESEGRNADWFEFTILFLHRLKQGRENRYSLDICMIRSIGGKKEKSFFIDKILNYIIIYV